MPVNNPRVPPDEKLILLIENSKNQILIGKYHELPIDLQR